MSLNLQSGMITVVQPFTLGLQSMNWELAWEWNLNICMAKMVFWVEDMGLKVVVHAKLWIWAFAFLFIPA